MRSAVRIRPAAPEVFGLWVFFVVDLFSLLVRLRYDTTDKLQNKNALSEKFLPQCVLSNYRNSSEFFRVEQFFFSIMPTAASMAAFTLRAE